MGDVAYDLRVANSNLLGIVSADQFNEELLQRMRLRDFHGPHFLPSLCPSCAPRNKSGLRIDTLNPDAMQVTIEPLLTLDARAGHGVSRYLLAVKEGGCQFPDRVDRNFGSVNLFPLGTRKTEAEWSVSTFQAGHRGSRLSVTLVRFV